MEGALSLNLEGFPSAVVLPLESLIAFPTGLSLQDKAINSSQKRQSVKVVFDSGTPKGNCRAKLKFPISFPFNKIIVLRLTHLDIVAVIKD